MRPSRPQGKESTRLHGQEQQPTTDRGGRLPRGGALGEERGSSDSRCRERSEWENLQASGNSSRPTLLEQGGRLEAAHTGPQGRIAGKPRDSNQTGQQRRATREQKAGAEGGGAEGEKSKQRGRAGSQQGT